MAAELIKSVLAAEAKGRAMEQDAYKKREKMISEQEYFRAINKIKEKYNTIYNSDR